MTAHRDWCNSRNRESEPQTTGTVQPKLLSDRPSPLATLPSPHAQGGLFLQLLLAAAAAAAAARGGEMI
jgi:hypothetical protein